jgi:hypothetical protein
MGEIEGTRMRARTPADFHDRARLAEMRAARASNAALREALLKVAASWRRLIAARSYVQAPASTSVWDRPL